MNGKISYICKKSKLSMMIEVECQVESSCALSKLRLKGG